MCYEHPSARSRLFTPLETARPNSFSCDSHRSCRSNQGLLLFLATITALSNPPTANVRGTGAWLAKGEQLQKKPPQIACWCGHEAGTLPRTLLVRSLFPACVLHGPMYDLPRVLTRGRMSQVFAPRLFTQIVAMACTEAPSCPVSE